MSFLIALTSGLLFGIGLILSGMTDPSKIKSFLDVFGLWDPSLGLVMGGAIAVGAVGFALAKRRTASWTGHAMEIPTSSAIDGRLILGGVLFGAGWGIAGYCPGPAIVAAATGSSAALVFIAAMLAGMTLHDKALVKRPKSGEEAPTHLPALALDQSGNGSK